MNRKFFKYAVTIMMMVFFLAACGAETVTVADIPVFTGATALVPGEDPVADTLVQNMEQDAQLRTQIGAGGSIEQKAYRLPADASWDAVKSFYADALEGDGWESGLGGLGGDLASGIMDSVNNSNEFFQTAVWSRGDQNITIMRNVDPTNAENVMLMMSLATN